MDESCKGSMKFLQTHFTAQKMKFSTKDFFSKCDQIRRKLRIWSHLVNKSLMENFILCVVFVANIPIIYSLKTPENRNCSCVSGGINKNIGQK